MTPIIQRSALTLLTISLILVVTGCSSTTVKLDPKLTSESVRALAILPPSFPDTIQREHAYFIRQALEIELRSRGFVVLDASIVDRICPDAPCATHRADAKRSALPPLPVLSGSDAPSSAANGRETWIGSTGTRERCRGDGIGALWDRALVHVQTVRDPNGRG